MQPDLKALLHYKNDKIVAHFCYHHPEISFLEAKILFTDLMGWMWLKAKRASLNKKTYLFGPLLVLDKMWHTFILHTRDYIDFSMVYFGEYFHHEVEPAGLEYHIEESELADYLDDCFNHLQQEWVERRFSDAFIDL